MPRLVHRLSSGVELRVEIRNRLDDARTGDHRALLAVQELAELPRNLVPAPAVLHPLRRLAPHVTAEERVRRLGNPEGVVDVDILVPVDPLGRVPLLVLALLVEGEETSAAVVVLPREPAVTGKVNPPALLGVDRRDVDLAAAHPATLTQVRRARDPGRRPPPQAPPRSCRRGPRGAGLGQREALPGPGGERRETAGEPGTHHGRGIAAQS